MRNAVIIVGAVVVLVVGFVVAQGSGEDGQETTAGTVTTQATAPPAATTPEATTAAATTQEAAPAPPPEPEIPTVVVKDGKPVGGVKTLSFEKGEEVRFRIRADVDDEVHVHGFDKYVDTVAGKTVGVRFPARFDGKFEVELHDAELEIASLEVQP